MRVAEFERFRDPTAARYYDDDPPYLDALAAPDDSFGPYDYDSDYGSTDYADTGSGGHRHDGISEPVVEQVSDTVRTAREKSAEPAPVPVVALAQEVVRPARPQSPTPRPPTRSVARPAGRPPGWDREPAAALPEPARGWTPQTPREPSGRQRRQDAAAAAARTYQETPTYSGSPLYTEQVPTYSSEPAHTSNLPTWRGASTATPPTVPWTSDPRAARRATRTSERGAARRSDPSRRATRRKPNRLGCLPPLIIVGIVIFLSNGGVNFIKKQVDRLEVPTGVSTTVDAYYDDVERQDLTGAQAEVCSALRTAWVAGQAAATSDSKRGIVDHRIASKKKSGSDYTVRVSVTTAADSSTATLRVVKEAGGYAVCGGTNP
jgi:hypothetical protein